MRNLKNIFCLAACLALFGCADAIEVTNVDGNTETPQDPTPSNPSGTRPSTDPTPTNPTPTDPTPTDPTPTDPTDPTQGTDPVKVEDGVINPDDVCPTYRKCYNGNEFRYCLDGEIVSTTCPAGCNDDTGCVGFNASSCAEPYVVNDKNYAKGSTFSGVEYPSSVCPGELSAMMGVVKFEIPELGFYKVSIDTDGQNWGYIIAKSCNPVDEVTYSCKESGASTSFTMTFDKGTYYAFIAPQSLFSKDFDFRFSVAQAQYSTQICGTDGANAKLLALNEDSLDIMGSISSTYSSSYAELGQSCMNMTSQGPEDIYMFSLTSRTKISAYVNITTTGDDAPKTASLYIKNCNGGSPIVSNCSQADNHPSSVMLGTTLNAGDYLLFVDSGDKPYDYTLEIEKN